MSNTAHIHISIGEGNTLSETMAIGDNYCRKMLPVIPRVDPAIIRKYCTFPAKRPAGQVGRPPKEQPPATPRRAYRIVTTAECDKIKRLWADGLHIVDIAAAIKRDRTMVANVLRRAGTDTSVPRIKRSAAASVAAMLRGGATVRDVMSKRRESARRIIELAVAGGMTIAEIDGGKEAA